MCDLSACGCLSVSVHLLYLLAYLSPTAEIITGSFYSPTAEISHIAISFSAAGFLRYSIPWKCLEESDADEAVRIAEAVSRLHDGWEGMMDCTLCRQSR